MKLAETPAVVPEQPQDNASDLLARRVQETPDRPLFALPNGDEWTELTAAEFEKRVIALAKGLAASGINPGDKIGFICRTRYEWSLVDFAIWYAGAVMVPVYETSSPSQIHWIMENSGAESIIIESLEHFDRFDEVHPELPAVKTVWQMHTGDLDKLVQAGVDIPDEEIERRRNLAVGSDIATLIYTSGSTGRPRGVVLTHSNFTELSRNAAFGLSEVVREPGASTLLFVTLAHVFARFISVLAVHSGVKVGHQPDTSKLVPSMGTFKPTFLLAVPRVFEKVYNSAEQKAEGGGKGKIFRWAAKVAVDHSKAVQEGSVPFGLQMKFKVAESLVLNKLKVALGGRVKYAVSGSAPLGLYLGHFYHSLGIKILEGYGLTETTAPVSVNLPSNFKIGTVGPPLPGHTVKIADDGELLVKGVDVFKEYWQDPEETKKAFTEDGFFMTGDLAKLDEEGYITITGRKKEILVTAGGKNVSPAALEDPIRANPLISQVVVIGDQRPFIAALITLDQEMLPVWLNNNGEDASMPLTEAVKHPKILEEVQRAVDLGNSRVSRAESIRKFVILPLDFTEANGHLTPKMSIKRANILRDFSHEVEGIYGNNPPATEGVSITGG